MVKAVAASLQPEDETVAYCSPPSPVKVTSGPEVETLLQRHSPAAQEGGKRQRPRSADAVLASAVAVLAAVSEGARGALWESCA